MKPKGEYYSSQRVGIFIDVGNLYHSAKNLYHGRVNYQELVKNLVGGRELIRAMAYVVRSEGVEGQTPNQSKPGAGLARGNEHVGSSESAFFDALVKAAETLGVSHQITAICAPVWDFDTQRPSDWMAEWALTHLGAFDGLWVGEFIEHIAACTALVDALDTLVAPGGAVCYSCPLGPMVDLAHPLLGGDPVWPADGKLAHQLHGLGRPDGHAPVRAAHTPSSLCAALGWDFVRPDARCPARPRRHLGHRR